MLVFDLDVHQVSLHQLLLAESWHGVLGYHPLHQGDGTALIFQEDPAVFTFSVHGASNFPARKQKSSIDVPLPDNTGDEVFLRCAVQQPGLQSIPGRSAL